MSGRRAMSSLVSLVVSLARQEETIQAQAVVRAGRATGWLTDWKHRLTGLTELTELTGPAGLTGLTDWQAD